MHQFAAYAAYAVQRYPRSLVFCAVGIDASLSGLEQGLSPPVIPVSLAEPVRKLGIWFQSLRINLLPHISPQRHFRASRKFFPEVSPYKWHRHKTALQLNSAAGGAVSSTLFSVVCSFQTRRPFGPFRYVPQKTTSLPKTPRTSSVLAILEIKADPSKGFEISGKGLRRRPRGQERKYHPYPLKLFPEAGTSKK